MARRRGRKRRRGDQRRCGRRRRLLGRRQRGVGRSESVDAPDPEARSLTAGARVAVVAVRRAGVGVSIEIVARRQIAVEAGLGEGIERRIVAETGRLERRRRDVAEVDRLAGGRLAGSCRLAARSVDRRRGRRRTPWSSYRRRRSWWCRRARRRHRPGTGDRVFQRRAEPAGILRLAPSARVAIDLVGGSRLGVAVERRRRPPCRRRNTTRPAHRGPGSLPRPSGGTGSPLGGSAGRPVSSPQNRPVPALLAAAARVAERLVVGADRRLQEQVIAGDQVAIEARLGEGVELGIVAEILGRHGVARRRLGARSAPRPPPSTRRFVVGAAPGQTDAWATAPHTASERTPASRRSPGPGATTPARPRAGVVVGRSLSTHVVPVLSVVTAAPPGNGGDTRPPGSPAAGSRGWRRRQRARHRRPHRDGATVPPLRASLRW